MSMHSANIVDVSSRNVSLVGVLHPDNSLDLQPFFPVDKVPPGPWARLDLTPPENVITVELSDAAGQVLARQQFPTIAPCVYPSGSVTNELILAATIAVPANTRTVRFIRSGNTIRQLQVPDSPPQVNLSWKPPAPPAFVVGRQVVSWNSSQAPSGQVHFLVQYSNDGGASWQPLSMVTDATQLELNFDQLPGGNAKLRILASDGVNTALAESPSFLVGPPIISVTPSTLNFGRVPVGVERTMSFQVRNNGTSPLTISGISAPVESAFTIVGPPANQIAPSGTSALRIQFAPPDVGPYSDVITIQSNDPRQPSLELFLKGTGYPPREYPPHGAPNV